MSQIEFQGGEAGGGGFTPLPAGDYAVQIDKLEQMPPKEGKDYGSLRIDIHIYEGEEVDTKSIMWCSLSPNAGWRLANLLEATGIEFEQIETDNLDTKGKPLFNYRFDSDNMIGVIILAACGVKTAPNGNINNEWTNERVYDDAGEEDGADAAAGTSKASSGETPAEGEAAGETPARGGRRTVQRPRTRAN